MSVAPARPAATTVILRDGGDGPEALLLLRNSGLDFHGGEWVFPGGRVDAEDAPDGAVDGFEAARRSAVREAKEEAGVVVPEAALVPIAHWTTPEVLPKRFATWFFLVPTEGVLDVNVDGGEITSHRWVRPRDALSLRDTGDILLPPPTFVTLLWLRDFERVVDAVTHFASSPVARFLPRPLIIDGDVTNLLEGDVSYENGDGTEEGPRHRVVMAGGAWRYERDFDR